MNQRLKIRVHWQLSAQCDYDCPYCQCDLRADDELLDRQRLLAIAGHIIGSGAEGAEITFGGGEPAMHPWLADIVFHLLSRGKNISVRIETNGSRDLDYFKTIVAGVEAARLSFCLHIHPDRARLSHILTLAAMLAESGHNVEAAVYDDGTGAAQTAIAAIARLAETVPIAWRQVDAGSEPITLAEPPDWRIDCKGRIDPPLPPNPTSRSVQPPKAAFLPLFEPALADLSLILIDAQADSIPWLNALLGANRRLDIIIAASSATLAAELEDFARSRPRSVRIARPRQAGGAIEMADCLCLAAGRYVTIAQACLRPVPGAFGAALAAMRETGADLGVFGAVNAFYNSKDDLRAALAEGDFAPLAGYAIYDRAFLAAKVNCQLPGGPLRAQCLTLRALGAASKVLADSGPLWRKAEATDEPVLTVADLDALLTEAQACARSLAAPELARLFHAFCRDHAGLFSGMDADPRKDYNYLVSIFSQPGLLELLLSQYAAAHCRRLGLCPLVHAADLDWSKPLPMPVPAWHAHANADEPTVAPPLLSVIMPNYNKARWLAASLESVCGQEFANFELIVIDDCSDDGSWEILTQWADADSRLRLYRMSVNCRQGICRNLGLEKARADYVIFADSDDICLPGFFAAALRLIKSSAADVALFSHCVNAENGAQIWRKDLPDAVWTSETAVRAWHLGEIEPAPWAKIFNRKFLARNYCRFPEYIYHQDVAFFLDVLSRARILACASQLAYAATCAPASASRPASANYLRIHSAYALYETLGRAVDRDFGASTPYPEGMDPCFHILWNLENILLEQIYAYQLAGQQLPLTAADRERLLANPHFLAALVRGYGACLVQLRLAGLAENDDRQHNAQAPLIRITFAAEADVSRQFLASLPDWAADWFAPAPPISDARDGAHATQSGDYLFAPYGAALPQWQELLAAAADLGQSSHLQAAVFAHDAHAPAADFPGGNDDAVIGALVRHTPPPY